MFFLGRIVKRVDVDRDKIVFVLRKKEGRVVRLVVMMERDGYVGGFMIDFNFMVFLLGDCNGGVEMFEVVGMLIMEICFLVGDENKENEVIMV